MVKIYADKAEREVLAKLFTEYLVKTDKEIADSYGFSPVLIRMWRTGERIGVNVLEYYASEIDKHAIAVTMHKQDGCSKCIDCGYSVCG